MRTLVQQLVIVLLPALAFVAVMGLSYRAVTAPVPVDAAAGLQEMGGEPTVAEEASDTTGGLQEPEGSGGLSEPPSEEPKEGDAPKSVGEAASPPIVAPIPVERPAGS